MPHVERNDGARIHYEVVGLGEPMLLLHGGGGSGEFWRRAGYVDALASDYAVMLLDLRGHGLSSRPHDASSYGMAFDADDIVAALDAAGFQSVNICGWSFGGSTALVAAALHPLRVARVIAIGASGHGRFADVPADLSYFAELAKRLTDKGMSPWADEAATLGGREWLRELTLRNDPAALAAWATAQAMTRPLAARLAEVSAPVLYVVGELEYERWHFTDPLLPLGAQMTVIPGADHVNAFLNLEVVVKQLRTFLGNTVPAARRELHA
jgi:pimeloyl-ACP methyl ester carboxylesterase